MTTDDAAHKEEYKPQWKNRRATIFGTLLLSGAIFVTVIIGWLLGREINAPMSVFLCVLSAVNAVVISVYVFNARIEDLNLAEILRGSK